MELQGRAHLNTVQQFDPNDAAVGGLTIRGQWEFVSGDDFMQILTRTDGTPAGGFGETANGVEFFVNIIGGSDSAEIRGRGGAAVVDTGPLGFPNGLGAGDILDFLIMLSNWSGEATESAPASKDTRSDRAGQRVLNDNGCRVSAARPRHTAPE